VSRPGLAALLALSAASSCTVQCNTGPVGGIDRHGPAQWTIDGHVFDVEATYWMKQQSGELIFEVDYLCVACEPQQMTEEQAYTAALPVLKYAVEHGLHEAGHPGVSRIAAVIIQRDGPVTKHYGLVRTVDQIRGRAGKASLDGGTAHAGKEP
jgi:hypothetical protein